MKISDIYKSKKTVFSLEVFPPKKSADVSVIYSTLDGLAGLSPDFISVTYGAGGNAADVKTREIAEIVKRDYGVESMAHLTCVSTAKEDAAAILDDFAAHGIENVLALRGDVNPEKTPKDDFHHASDLAAFIKERGGFDTGGACYPEVHPEAESSKTDIENLKKKVDAGVTFLISQLFFDNRHFLKFRERARAAGIFVPISPGIMPVTNAKQIERMVTMCGASIPRSLSRLLSKYADDPVSLTAAGIEYAADQIYTLICEGVEGIHLYTMNNPAVASDIYDRIKGLL